ncbi:DNA-3-methyladenine glycosylase family protein [Stutzerimonas azotifigens]|uniref:DNA-3-methyladenine glycosylase family protein n=1 Tax=Stutzerimonas azotifigens TaxID=291995 RepID=UPI00041A7E5D|nr:DNA-3-methyladenine glycosylase [Stutzerimonas azotifigens]
MSLHISHLPYREPWDWRQFHRHFSLRLLPGVEYLDDSSYARTFRLAGVSGWLRVRPLPGLASLELTLSELPETLHEHLERHVRHMFDLDRDPAQIQAHFADDPLLGPLVAASPALRLPAAFDPFEQAVRAVVGQQVSIKAAVTITRRIAERLGEPLVDAPQAGLDRLFPSPEAVAGASLDNIGMPARRLQTLQRLAAAIADGALELHVREGADELVERLCRLPGIGPWTAEYIALRAFGDPDAFPAADLGLLKAPLWGPGGIDARSLTRRAEAWRPLRAYAAIHLWQNYAGAPP